jgi:hypothetical protein
MCATSDSPASATLKRATIVVFLVIIIPPIVCLISIPCLRNVVKKVVIRESVYINRSIDKT